MYGGFGRRVIYMIRSHCRGVVSGFCVRRPELKWGNSAGCVGWKDGGMVGWMGRESGQEENLQQLVAV